MKAIDARDNLDLESDERKISSERLESICCIYQKEKTCKFIMYTRIGYVCAKHSNFAESLSMMSLQNKIVAKSDNCEGLGNRNETKEKSQENKETNQEEDDQEGNEEIHKTNT